MNLNKRMLESQSGPDVKRKLLDEKSRQHTLLNQGFWDFCQNADALATWEDAARDYEYYSMDLERKFSAGVSAQRGAQVLSFGSGDCGQLGHGVSDPPVIEEETSVVYPKPIKAFQASGGIRKISSGGLTNALVDAQGLWTWGCADGDALGREGDENMPTLVRFPGQQVTVLQVSLGDSHGCCVALGGQVFIWGSYRDKEGKSFFPTTAIVGGNPSSLSSPGTTMSSPQELKQPSGAVSLASGANHTVILLADGQVQTLGIGEQLQLGRKVDTELRKSNPHDSEDEGPQYDIAMLHREHLVPMKIDLNKHVKAVGCGAYHTLLVTSDMFRVYGCGLNQYHQVGASKNATVDFTHIQDLDGKCIIKVAGGEHFSSALGMDGRLYTWGRSDQGQLGREVPDQAGSSEPVPTIVPNLPPLEDVSCGSSHVLGLARSGKVLSWGFGDMAQLGHGKMKDETLPRPIDRITGKAAMVSAGAQHSVVVSAESN